MNQNIPTVPTDEVEAIVGGYHGDPFSVLGPHVGEANLTIRAFLPQASGAEVIDRQSAIVYSMNKLHDGGFFEATIPELTEAIDYYLQLKLHDGNVVLYEDPYAFSNTFSDYDEYLLAEGTHHRLYDLLGAHQAEFNGVAGVRFAVWAPNALRVSLVGEFNNWDGRRHVMRFQHGSGIWDIFMPAIGLGALYKFEIKTRDLDYTVVKSDPVAF